MEGLSQVSWSWRQKQITNRNVSVGRVTYSRFCGRVGAISIIYFALRTGLWISWILALCATFVVYHLMGAFFGFAGIKSMKIPVVRMPLQGTYLHDLMSSKKGPESNTSHKCGETPCHESGNKPILQLGRQGLLQEELRGSIHLLTKKM